ncbi:hypothetical protein [Paraburkholderia humisilvae]|uniref:Uncharacterized protein n=1 Tax=Paraburkholderia humisilvae TaxID=627669 RepID=A0A6J5DQ04_9BURK|nr:hypothetical protein [Paraburkholderia humisilvae]CAB3754936.1 hypothetical protein LMG29542_02495 [Paraburkholderia humisilvae]
MIFFVIRCVITFALLNCVQYSTDFTHADVNDPHPCLWMIVKAQARPGNACLYHDVALHGDPLVRRFWIGEPGEVQVESRDAVVEFSAGSHSGWTWRTYLLLLGAVLPWILSSVDAFIRIRRLNAQAEAAR